MLLQLAEGIPVGTQLRAATTLLSARKQWLADHLQLKGHVKVDDGARNALVRDGKSLLPIGVVETIGEFGRGDVISCRDLSGNEIARGLVNYSSAETRLIARHSSSEIALVLGFMNEPELIHRDNLVLT